MSYTNLIAKVKEQIGDPSITDDQIKGFIADAELAMERDLMDGGTVPRQMLARKTDQKSDANAKYAIPDDLLKTRSVIVSTSSLLYVPPEKLLTGDGYAESDVILDYYQRLPKLSDTTTTNWLLDVAQDMYTYAACVEYQPFAQDGTNVWTPHYARALDSVRKAYAPQPRGGRATVRRRPWGGAYTIIGNEILLGPGSLS